MVLKVSSPNSGSLSASEYASDPEKEISDDDDRNHKHRRRETRSQSADKDAVESFSTRPYRKQNRSSENGHGARESESQTSQSWNNHNPTASEKHFPGKFAKRPLDLNHRNRSNQSYAGDLAFGRGRGRDNGSWNHRNNRFMSLDLASQVVARGAIPAGMFPERGLPGIPNAQGAPWGGYGLIPGIPNVDVDGIHSIGFPGAFRPPISSSLGIPRQRCRDFEERGFCLRGDMCPMEHGINRIVVEDVQSLSQFNLPVSLPSGSILGVPGISGSLPSVGPTSSAMLNSKGSYGRNGKPGIVDDSMVSKPSVSEPAIAAGADFYDPDQPLWNSNDPETSSALVGLRSSAVDEAASLSKDDASDNQMNEVAAFERRDRTTLPVGSQATSSVWGRIRNSKGKNTSKIGISNNGYNEIMENQEALNSVPGSSNGEKRVVVEDTDPNSSGSTRVQSDAMRLTRKPSQKALRTLFISGIPLKNNRRDALLAHFQKFGKVIDIYIPINSERAFVQFLKREEAEAALRAPDAVMGNRFIKLFWANRDNILDDATSGVGISSIPRGATASSVPSALATHGRVKDNLQFAPKSGDFPTGDATGSPAVPPPLQKKLELEQLKEELRQKQEMLDRKRIDFKRKLDKLAKQATGDKGEDLAEQAPTRQKVEMASDQNTASVTLGSSDAEAACKDKVDDKAKLPENTIAGKPDISALMSTPESISLKRQSRPFTHPGMPFYSNRYKLDNRPTTFRILPPLPPGLADVAALKQHFSTFGDLTVVELEGQEANDIPNGSGSRSESGTAKSCSARIGYRDRQTAEQAFLNCKSWEGHNLQFVWVTPTTPSKATTNPSSSDNSVSTTKEQHVDSDVRTALDKAGQISTEERVNGESEHSERETSDNRAEPAAASASN